MNLLAGKKTYIAAIVMALVAANHVLHLVPASVEQTLLEIAGALGLVGVRAAIADAVAAANRPE